MEGLDRLIKLEKDARDFGFEWPDIDMIIDQSISEAEEVREAAREKDKAHTQEEIGDLLHTAISLCRFAGYDVKDTLAKTADKFEKRMNALKDVARERGFSSLQGQSTDFMMGLWSEAKKRSNK